MPELQEVLIVEDEPVVLKVAGMALKAHGIGHRTASGLTEASKVLAGESFRVVVTDLKLPGASGFEIFELVDAMQPRPEVVIITGYATIDNAVKSFQLGSFDFVPKPFDVEELVSVVHRALRYFEHPPRDLESDREQHFLGRHSWVRMETDGAATIGAAETFISIEEPIESIDCTDTDGHTTQGKAFCTLRSRDGLAHRVRAPLSGQVIAQNSRLDEEPELVLHQPFTQGWLVRVIPNDLDKELLNLGRRES
jgi:CheY-like chemotaxis protein/glycine cleavage system H lipoate-binding protein